MRIHAIFFLFLKSFDSVSLVVFETCSRSTIEQNKEEKKTEIGRTKRWRALCAFMGTQI